MEKKLLFGAVALFILELFLFLGDLGVHPWSPFAEIHNTHTQPEIGTVVWTRQEVKRKSKNSILWEASEKSDSLKTYDSLLTMENSSAKIKLQGDIEIDLHENTLVVLEPKDEDLAKSFRIQFQQGDIRSIVKNHRLKVGSGQWNVDAEAGSTLSIKSLNKGKIELEVTRGQVNLSHKEELKGPQKIAPGTRVQLDKNKIIETKFQEDSLGFTYPASPHRRYSFQFPVAIEVQWKGEPEKIRAVASNNMPIDFPVATLPKITSLFLPPGKWTLHLEKKDKISDALNIEVLPAEKIQYLAPLPRNRMMSSKDSVFSWLPINQAHRYELQFRDRYDAQGIIESHPTTKKQIGVHPNLLGPLQWQVIGIDKDGFEIPAFYQYELFNLKDPLEAPKLKSPSLREPASRPKRKKPKKTSWLNIFNPFPAAIAQELPGVRLDQKHVIFNWYPVSDADYYIIEISEDGNFLNPIVNEKILKNNFVWKKFEYKEYYYRVAAGKNDGRMGLFSEPEKVNLKYLATVVAKESLKTKQRIPIKTLKEKFKESHRDKTKPETQNFTVADKQESKDPDKPLLLTPVQSHWTAGLFWSGGYIVNEQSLDQSVKVSQRDGSINRYGGSFGIPLGQNGHLKIQGEYTSVDWKPDSKKIPFQKDLKGQELFTSILYAKKQSPHGSGLFFQTLSIGKRKDSESIALKDKAFYGYGFASGLQFFETWNTRHFLGIGYGDPFFILTNNNYVFRDLNFWKERSGNIGIEFNIRYGQGTKSLNFINSHIMFRLGFEFQ